MNYPVWELYGIGGGTLIAIISVLHAYIAHLAVGGGIFIWLTDWKGFRENNPKIHDYVYKHTWFFLLLTMVFGGVSGVGIWFIIALVQPAATSSLIHNFVFGWAIEWVFFLGEITALLVYYYHFKNLERKPRLTIAFFYALFAWLSLFIINGILAFMLTPGKWLETGAFWDGFLNPTFFPSLFFRTFMTLIIAGLFGFLTIVFQRDSEFKQTMIKYCSKWLWFALPGLVLSAIWYYFAVPANIRTLSFDLNPQTAPFMTIFLISSIAIYILSLLYLLKSGVTAQRILAFVLVLIGLCWYGGFEYTREIARKPYIINQYMYSSSVKTYEVAKINKEGMLKNAKWTAVKKTTAENRLEAGRELFNIQCLPCHTINGLRNPVVPKTADLTHTGLMASLSGQGKINGYMPPFMGTQQEMEALAAFIFEELQNNPPTAGPAPAVINPVAADIPPFDRKKDEYILLAWNDLGMHCISDSDPWFVILPPANTLEAQLIKRGELPVLVSEGVMLEYEVETGYENPAKQVQFWDYVEKNFGTALEKNIGLHGNGLIGTMKYNDERAGFIAETIPVVPYKADGSYNPYPLFTIRAKDSGTGKVLAETKVVAPTTTEMGCKGCHGGDWKNKNGAGIADETAINILKAHDRLNGTSLYKNAQAGNPRLCQSCHADPALGAEGKAEQMNLSTSIHGWHAAYMPFSGGEACVQCHPAKPDGPTRCSRGVHASLGFTCEKCHGTLNDHAISLLKGQEGKPSQSRVLANLIPVQVNSKDDAQPRTPWLNGPDCITCHIDYQKPAPSALGYNQWNDDFSELYRMRTDYAGIRCEACHGATHALYPAVNPYEAMHDNIQPMQYDNQPYPIGSNKDCAICHTIDLEDPIHHENMRRSFRHTEIAAIK